MPRASAFSFYRCWLLYSITCLYSSRFDWSDSELALIIFARWCCPRVNVFRAASPCICSSSLEWSLSRVVYWVCSSSFLRPLLTGYMGWCMRLRCTVDAKTIESAVNYPKSKRVPPSEGVCDIPFYILVILSLSCATIRRFSRRLDWWSPKSVVGRRIMTRGLII